MCVERTEKKRLYYVINAQELWLIIRLAVSRDINGKLLRCYECRYEL